jgi:adenylosuccinate synthase
MLQVDVIVGALWGDEGKGKLVGAIGRDYDAVLRVNASTNAGHCVDDGTRVHVTRQLPSVFFPQATLLVIGPGALLNLVALADEAAARPDPDHVRGKVRVASSVALVLRPYVEKGQGGMSRLIGSTHQGTGPTAVARAARHALHLYDVEAVVRGEPGAADEALAKLVRTCVETSPDRFAPDRYAPDRYAPDRYAADRYAPDRYAPDRYAPDRYADGRPDTDAYCRDVLAELVAAFRRLEQALGAFCVDYTALLFDLHATRRRALIEGCNGLLLDNLHGAHPNVTSASTNLGAMLCGANVSPASVGTAYVVAAAYTTCLGKRPFPTEMPAADAAPLRARCDEVDVAQHEPRRLGWFDAPALRKALSGCHGAVLHLNKLDALGGPGGPAAIKLCTRYRLGARTVDVMPDDPRLVRLAVPEYVEVPGWTEPIGDVRRFDALPAAAQEYVRHVQRLLPNEVVSVGVGPRNDDLVRVPALRQ